MYIYIVNDFTIFNLFQKMTKLMDILSNPNKRLAYDVLLRCESVLEHMVILLGTFQIDVSANSNWAIVFSCQISWKIIYLC